jgi:hypothetical protein
VSAPSTITFSTDDLYELQSELEGLSEITSFADQPALSERLAAIGMAREVGTVNDELARFIFDADRGVAVDRETLEAEFVEWQGRIGVRISSTVTTRLELRAQGFAELTHPRFSRNPDGTIHSLFVFPRLVAEIAALRGVELVVVKSWAMNSIFGGFDPAKAYYQTNFWELENNDSLKFADLVRKGRLAFLGTHDLIAHVAGTRSEAWTLLRAQAEQVHHSISRYFANTQEPTIASLVLPYTAGVVLDDLAQPPTYGSRSHANVLDALLEALDAEAVPANLPTVLTRFPDAFERVIAISRDIESTSSPFRARRAVAKLVAEIREASLTTSTVPKPAGRIMAVFLLCSCSLLNGGRLVQRENKRKTK